MFKMRFSHPGVALVFLTSMAWGCGGGGQQTGLVSLSASEFAALQPTFTELRYTPPRPGFRFRLEMNVSLRERGGVGATINAGRLVLRQGLTEVERIEVPGATIGAAAGSNHVAARGTLAFSLAFDFNSADADTGELLLVIADDNGHSFTTPGAGFQLR